VSFVSVVRDRPVSRSEIASLHALSDSATLSKEANRYDDDNYYGDDLDPICQCHVLLQGPHHDTESLAC